MIDERLCDSKHKSIEDQLDHHERWLGEHENKIDELKTSDATNTNEIKNLCRQMSSLTKAIWGLVVMVGTSLLGFFFFAVQTHIFTP